MRLQKYMANCGVASRRKCEALIAEGKVTINGQVITELGTQVNQGDIVCYLGEKLSLEEDYVYYMLNKPAGYVTTVQDDKDRPTVINLLPNEMRRVYPVGRLDYNTSGLLILTNDGDLTYELTHPKHHVNKCYEVKVKGPLSESTKRALRSGIVIEGKRTYPAELRVIRQGEKASLFHLTIHEGRNRQVRKMCEAVGCPVLSLKRVAIGKLKLGTLKLGEYRELTKQEVGYLKNVHMHGHD